MLLVYVALSGQTTSLNVLTVVNNLFTSTLVLDTHDMHERRHHAYTNKQTNTRIAARVFRPVVGREAGL